MALFGKTAKQWRDENQGEKGNIRDYANVSQLVCLANLRLPKKRSTTALSQQAPTSPMLARIP